ncbi:MAG: DUF4159 domain-containing protein [Tepidisphaeraceae bacterium]
MNPDDVDKAIAKGVEYLYSVQQPDGTWETEPAPPAGPIAKVPDDKSSPSSDNNQYGGKTALAVYALLEAGQRPTEPKLKKAIDFLRTKPSVSTYTLSLRCQVWANLPPTPEVKQALRRDAAALMAGKKLSTAKNLVWDYAQFVTPRYNYSLNNVQNAAWGLDAAGDMDYEVPADLWKQIEKTFADAQQKDGAFGYIVPYAKVPNPATTVYSTTTGISALFLAQDHTRADAYATPRGNATSPTIEKGIAWITNKLDPDKDDQTTESVHRRWYGIGTVALASGMRTFGEADWYALGAADLMKRQSSRDGHWGQDTAKYGDYRVTDTAWAVLFLQRCRLPVAFNKFNYAAGATDAAKAFWNQRPRDAANAAAWVGRAMERELRWQIVDANDSVDALLESPVLYLAGTNALDLKPETKAKLKTYVESGGLIFAVAEANSAAFGKSVEKLAAELVPGNEWRDVPDTHPIFANQMFKRPAFKNKPVLRAIGNGIREFVVLAPTGDPSRTWQGRSGKINADHWQLAANVLSYAVDKSHFYTRGESWLVPESKRKPDVSMRIARLQYNGSWNPEPLAFKQFENYAAIRGVGVEVKTVAAGDEIKDADCLYVTGTSAFTFDEKTRAAIKTYLDNGGRIFFEAAGGNAAFAASASSGTHALVRRRRDQCSAANAQVVWRKAENQLPQFQQQFDRKAERADPPRRGKRRPRGGDPQSRRPDGRPAGRSNGRHHRLHARRRPGPARPGVDEVEVKMFCRGDACVAREHLPGPAGDAGVAPTMNQAGASTCTLRLGT